MISMFYSQDILQKRGGKFGIIWVAATQASQLSRRDYSRVNIRRTCEDIISYICCMAPPLRPGGARPKFSLYLSSQLMYGVIRVYDKQQSYLLNEVRSLSTDFLAMASTVTIDMRAGIKPDTVTSTPDIMLIHKMPVFNPEFGLMKSPSGVDVLESLPEIEYVRFESPVVLSALRKSSLSSDISLGSPQGDQKQKTPSPVFTPVIGSPHQAPVSKITMEEPLPEKLDDLFVPANDLPPLQLSDLQQLNDQTEGPFIVNVSPIKKDKRTAHDILEESIANMARIVVQQTDENQPMFTLFDDKEAVLAPTEETGLVLGDIPLPSPPKKQKKQIVDEVTELHEDVATETEEIGTKKVPVEDAQRDEEDEGVRERTRPKRKRKSYDMTLVPVDDREDIKRPRPRRQLQFTVDAVTQIPKETFKQQLSSGEETTAPVELPMKPLPLATDLLNTPGNKGLYYRRLLPLWRRCSVTHANKDEPDLLHPCWSVPYLGDTSSSSGSDQDAHLQKMAHALQDIGGTVSETSPDLMQETPQDNLDQAEMARVDQSIEKARVDQSIERARDISMERSAVGIGAQMDSSTRSRLENISASDNESMKQSFTGRDTPLREETIIESAIPEASLGVLKEVSELEQLEELEAQIDKDILRSKVHSFLREFYKLAGKNKQCNFRDLYPPRTTKRHTAANAFQVMLDCAVDGLIKVTQEKPFGDIHIYKL